MKYLLREAGIRTKETLTEAMGRVLAAESSEDVRGFFAHCDYRTSTQ